MLLHQAGSRTHLLHSSYVNILLSGFQWLIEVTARLSPFADVEDFKDECARKKLTAQCCEASVVCFRETLTGVRNTD